MSPSDIFIKRQTEFTQRARIFQRRYNQLSTVRLIVFGAAVFTVWQTLSLSIWIPLVCGTVGLILFAVILRRHQATKRQWELHRALAALRLWAAAEQDRKTAWKLFLHFGPLLALRALTRTIGLGAALGRAGKRIGLSARLVPLSDAEAAIDVDKPSDHAQAEEILAKR